MGLQICKQMWLTGGQESGGNFLCQIQQFCSLGVVSKNRLHIIRQ
jgi:hypothetical protein